METVEHLIETGLGQSQEGNVLRKSGAPSLPAGGRRVDCKPCPGVDQRRRRACDRRWRPGHDGVSRG